MQCSLQNIFSAQNEVVEMLLIIYEFPTRSCLSSCLPYLTSIPSRCFIPSQFCSTTLLCHIALLRCSVRVPLPVFLLLTYRMQFLDSFFVLLSAISGHFTRTASRPSPRDEMRQFVVPRVSYYNATEFSNDIVKQLDQLERRPPPKFVWKGIDMVPQNKVKSHLARRLACEI